MHAARISSLQKIWEYSPKSILTGVEKVRVWSVILQTEIANDHGSISNVMMPWKYNHEMHLKKQKNKLI